MSGLLIGVGLISLQQFVTVSQVVKIGLNLTSCICSSINDISHSSNDVMFKVIDEEDLECKIRTVESILRKKYNSKLNDDTEYVYVPTQNDFFESSTPEEVVLYYLYDSTTKINELLMSVKQKKQIYGKSWLKFWSVIDFNKESEKLRKHIYLLEKRLGLYGSVKSN